MGSSRAVRGGSWNNNARRARSAYRNDNERGNRDNNLGFRFALSSKAGRWSAWICWTEKTRSVLDQMRRPVRCGG
jgi:hypothetical protein